MAQKTVSGVGAGVFSRHKQPVLMKLETYNSIFTAEYIAIFKALELIDEDRDSQHNCVIMTDSLSVLQDLIHQNNNSSRLDLRIKVLELYTKLITKDYSITLVWVPSHIGFNGNERADQLAKSAISQGSDFYAGMGIGECKAIIKSKMQGIWQKRWEDSEKGRIMYQIKNKVSRKPLKTLTKVPINVALTRLRLNKAAFTLKEPHCSECDKKIQLNIG